MMKTDDGTDKTLESQRRRDLLYRRPGDPLFGAIVYDRYRPYSAQPQDIITMHRSVKIRQDSPRWLMFALKSLSSLSAGSEKLALVGVIAHGEPCDHER